MHIFFEEDWCFVEGPKLGCDTSQDSPRTAPDNGLCFVKTWGAGSESTYCVRVVLTPATLDAKYPHQGAN